MSGFLTPSSTMTCPHGGMVQAVPSNTRVMAGGAPILLATDSFVIAGCAFVIGVVPSPCVTVVWMQTAMRSTISAPPLTMASLGMCVAATGATQGPVIIAGGAPNVTGQ